MWAATTNGDYTIVDDKVVHQRSGLALHWPPAVQWTAPRGPYILAATPAANWSAIELHIDEIENSGRAYQMNIPCSTFQEKESFRRRFGSLSIVEKIISPIDEIDRVRWDEDLITTVANLFFVAKDIYGFANGHQAFPDKLEFAALEIPEFLRKTVINPFAKNGTWLGRLLRQGTSNR